MWDGHRKRSKSTGIDSKEERERVRGRKRETLFLLAGVISESHDIASHYV